MASTVYKIFTDYNMPPGATWTRGWNNIPQGNAHMVYAEPWWPGSYQTGYQSTTQLEVTRTWRRTRVIQKPGSIGVDVEVRRDIFFELRNVGDHVLNFDIYLVVFS